MSVSYVDFMTQFAGKGVAGEPTGLVAVASGIASITPPPPPSTLGFQSTPACLQTQFGIFLKIQKSARTSKQWVQILPTHCWQKKPTKHEDLHFAV